MADQVNSPISSSLSPTATTYQMSTPVGPARLRGHNDLAIQQSSRTWNSAANQARHQQQRASRSEQYAQARMAQNPVQVARSQWPATRSRVLANFPRSDSSDLSGERWNTTPRSSGEWRQHWRELTDEQASRLGRMQGEIQATLNAIEAEKEQGRKLKLRAFGGKRFAHPRGAVLGHHTIWTSGRSDLDSSIWPTQREWHYEGIERQDSTEPKNGLPIDYNRYLPLVRDWTVEEQEAKHRLDQNARYWEHFDAKTPYPFDTLACHKKPAHLEIYPFGAACPIETETNPCHICQTYRRSYGINEEETYQAAIQQYNSDLSVEVMRSYLPHDLFTAL